MQQADERAVVIAGGGPTGLMLAAELHLAGVAPLVVERRTSQDLDGSRAGGLHARTIEVLDQRGVAERFLEAGQVMQTTGYAYTILDISDFPTRHPYGLALWQRDFERILADWVLGELGVEVRRGVEVVGLDQDDDGVDVALSDGTTVRAGYLVGCDGGRSTVRKAAAIDFPGLEASTSWMIAEVEMDGEPELGFHRDEAGRQQVLGQRQPGEPVRAVFTEATADRNEAPTMDELRSELERIYGTDFGLRSASWISWFTDASRQAAEYRRGRVLLAGDAAHIHPPQGGQGMNLGVQDAVNLGWKLALVATGAAPSELLDSYHAERHPVAEQVRAHSSAMVALATPGDRHEALRRTVAELVVLDEPRRRLAGQLSALDVHYEPGDHPLVGWRMPDLDLETEPGATTVVEQLRSARPVLLDLRDPVGADPLLAGWAERISVVRARATVAWELPVVGEVPSAEVVLLRPDGHVAWAGSCAGSWAGPADEAHLADAASRWFGPPDRDLRP